MPSTSLEECDALYWPSLLHTAASDASRHRREPMLAEGRLVGAGAVPSDGNWHCPNELERLHVYSDKSLQCGTLLETTSNSPLPPLPSPAEPGRISPSTGKDLRWHLHVLLPPSIHASLCPPLLLLHDLLPGQRGRELSQGMGCCVGGIGHGLGSSAAHVVNLNVWLPTLLQRIPCFILLSDRLQRTGCEDSTTRCCH